MKNNIHKNKGIKRSKKYGNRKLNKKRVILVLFISLVIILMIILALKNSKLFKDNKNSILVMMEDVFDGITENSVFPEKVYGTKVITELLKEGTNKRSGEKRKIKYLVIHETDNKEKGADAKNHSEYLLSDNGISTSWHYTVDSTKIYHHIPDNEIANHAGTYEGNKSGVGIELCVNKDGDFEKTFDNAAKLVAYLLKEYHLELNDIKMHHDFSGKDCPNTIIRDNRMDEFKEKVKEYSKK